MANWRGHLAALLATFFGLIGLSGLLVWIANPYGNLPLSPLRHVLMDDNQRFQYPAVIRSGRYDSLVMGTSTARLLKPAELEAAFGGRFANLALNSGTAWEQMRLVQFFAETVPQPRMLLLALDHVWCAGNADRERITARGFPEWMLDQSPWNDIGYMLNIRTVEIAGRRIGHALGLVRERWPHNGYEVFVPPESEYDLARARQHIFGISPPDRRRLRDDAGAPRFPALTWLDAMIDRRQPWQRIAILLTPVHQAELPKPGTREEAREAACKDQIRGHAARHGVPVVDFRIRSPVTTRDENYWDRLHYRVPIATRIIDGLARALAAGKDDPGGDWRMLNAPAPADRRS